jgi:amidase
MASVRLPTPSELVAVAKQLGMTLSDGDVAFFLETMAGSVAAYGLLDGMADNLPPVKYPRAPGYRPEGQENPYNAWYYKTEVKGAPSGKLAGKRVALKDNVCLAGVPMMNGASTLEGYVPDVDATIVTRILDAGGTIAGKVHCEYFCFSGGSHTGAAGPVHNPRKMGYSAGGSSSGSAVVVAAGEVPMAIGGDQGGSIRIPAAYCGIYGLKPTHGLVPYTGVMPIELTLDHTGPMTATVTDNALLLEVLAGPDGLDPRQIGVTVAAYTEALTGSAAGMKIAVVKEGFGHPGSESVVDQLVRRGAERFKQLGCTVEEVAIPLHLLGPAIWTPIAVEGATWQMMNGNGYGFNWKGLYVTSLIDAHANWRSRADELSDTLKATILLGQHVLNKHRGPRGLRLGPGDPRPAPHADVATAGDEAADRGSATRRDHRASLRDAPKHDPIRRHRASRDEYPVRYERRAARRHDAGWQAVGRTGDLPGRPRLRAVPRLDEGDGLSAKTDPGLLPGDAPSNLGLRPPRESREPGVRRMAAALRPTGLLARLGAEDAGEVPPPRYSPATLRQNGDGPMPHPAQ